MSRSRTRVKLKRVFPADDPRLVPSAVVSLHDTWGQLGSWQSVHARHQLDEEAFRSLERVIVTPAVYPGSFVPCMLAHTFQENSLDFLKDLFRDEWHKTVFRQSSTLRAETDRL